LVPQKQAWPQADSEKKDDSQIEALCEKGLIDDRLERLNERWRFDCASESVGADEEDRVLFNDFNPK
jgi:hypothetical protein